MHDKDAQPIEEKCLQVVSSSGSRILSADPVRRAFRYNWQALVKELRVMI